MMSLFSADVLEAHRWARVGDFYEVTRKPRDLDLAAHPIIPFAPMEGIPLGGEFQPRYSEKTPNEITSGTYFERGDVLVAKITPSFENGKQALADELRAEFGYATTEVIPLRPTKPGQDRRFLFFYLLHPTVRSYVAEKMHGSTGRQRVPEDVLLDLPYPVIAKHDQTAIADALALVQRATKIERQLLEKWAHAKRAATREVFRCGLRRETQRETELGLIPDSWDVIKLGSLGRVGNGSTPKKSKAEYWISGTYPWLTSAKVYDRNIQQADQFVTARALAECHLPKVKPGAVLIAITGQGKTLGHCGVLEIEATINQHIAYVALDTKRADPSFVRGYLETQYEYLRQVGSGGGSTKGALTCAFLRTLPIPLPLLDQQREIVAILDAIDQKIEGHKQKRDVLEDLFKALLHKLVIGEVGIPDLNLGALESETKSEVS
jgi:type I restriction enzyme S subunit